MASGWYTTGLLKILDGTIDLDTDTVKVMLVKSTYTFNPDQDLIDDGSADDLASHEVDASGYTGGFGGAGRKTVTVTMQSNDTDNRVDIAIADLTWTTLGTGNTIGGAALVREITNDG